MRQDLVPKGIETFNSGNFWVFYGKNSTGKTHMLGSFPNILVVVFNDQGAETLKKFPHVKYIIWNCEITVDKTTGKKVYIGNPEELIEFCKMYKDSPFDAIAFDTFGVYQDFILQMIKDSLNTKKLTQNMWGDFGDHISNVLLAMKELSQTKTVIVSFHEQPETIEGYENEIVPNVSVAVYGNVVKKVLYGIANYVVHTFIYDYVNPQTMKSQYYHACHVGVNPYYWTKFQTQHTVPEIIFNPSYGELMKIKQGAYNPVPQAQQVQQ